MKITKKLFWEAPKGGYANCFISSYTSLKTNSLIGTKDGDYRGAVTRTIIRSEDNGETWREVGAFDAPAPEGEPTPREGDLYCRLLDYMLAFYLDPNNGLLVQFYCVRPARERVYSESAGPESFRKYYYRISRDEGRSWGKARQIIQSGKEYNTNHWARGVYLPDRPGYIGGVNDLKTLEDGTILLPVQIIRGDKKYIWLMASAAVRGRWRADLSDIDWEVGQLIELPPERSVEGVDEATFARLKNGKLLAVMRADPGAPPASPELPYYGLSLKYYALSEDDGLTWTEPKPFVYDKSDGSWTGSIMFSPTAISALIRSSKNGKLYWIGNILERNASTPCRPRYPIQIAEVNEDVVGIKREIVAVIDDLKEGEGTPEYSNFCVYEDRVSRNLILTLTDAKDPYDAARFPPREVTTHSCNYVIEV